MLSSDLPIAKLEEDELNRGSFAESLAKTLVQYSFPSSLTIGLYGEWGSGKTSLLNMVFENVEQIDDGVVVLRFNPWLCSDSKQLVTQFFKQMATAIKLKNKKAEKVWELIDQYADVFDATSLIPVVGGGIAAFFRAIAKKAGQKVEKRTKDLQESKDQIIEKLKDEKMKIIVSIDDIDRLSEEEIVAVFQLVKSLADFPNTMDSKARASLMCSIFENEKVQVSTVALLLQDFENQLGRYAENARESADAVLPLDAVLKLEAIFKERAVKAIDSKVVLRQYHGLRFLWLLEQIAPETAADKKKSMVTDDVSLVKIIDECTSRGSVAVRIVAKTRTVDRDRLSEFVDLGEAYQRVKKFATENQFFDLPRDEQMSAVAFILIVERGPVESSLKDCIAEDAIMKALDQMGSKIETDDTKRD